MTNLTELLNLWDFEYSSFNKEFIIYSTALEKYLLENPKVNKVNIKLNLLSLVPITGIEDKWDISSAEQVFISRNPSQLKYEAEISVTRDTILNRNLKLSYTADFKNLSFYCDLPNFNDKREYAIQCLTYLYLTHRKTFTNKDGIIMMDIIDPWTNKTRPVKRNKLRKQDSLFRVIKNLSPKINSSVNNMEFFPITEAFFTAQVTNSMIANFSPVEIPHE